MSDEKKEMKLFFKTKPRKNSDGDTTYALVSKEELQKIYDECPDGATIFLNESKSGFIGNVLPMRPREGGSDGGDGRFSGSGGRRV